MAKKKVTSRKSSKQDDKKLFAFLAVFLSIVGFLIALLGKRDDKYVMFYAKQSLVLFIGFMGAWVINIIPILGQIISLVMHVVLIILWIIAIINSVSGQQKETPIIGQYADQINL